MDLSGRKILICEEALINHNGHFQSWIRSIRKMHLNAGAKVFVAGNIAVIDEVREDLEVMPIYTVNSWDQRITGNLPAWRRHLHVFVQNFRIFRETRKALIATGQVDILFFTAVRVHHIIGLRLLCAWGLGRRFKRMTCFLLTSQTQYNADFTSFQFPRQAGLIAAVLKSFKQLVARDLVILAGDSHITCSEYETLTSVPMTLFPSPGADLRYEKKSQPRKGPVFSILGVSTWDKGIDIFQDAMLRFLERNPSTAASFVLQWSVPCESSDGSVISISERLREHPHITLLEHRLSNEEYATYFREADFIVLPYRKVTYYNRISGVAVEAAVSGKPIIVTENTWLAWAMHEFGTGITVPEDDVEAWCAAFEKCCVKRKQMCATARERAKVALEYNSAERYLSILWDGGH
jgi:glycosyltransferase involved in cell wall biosynthesis